MSGTLNIEGKIQCDLCFKWFQSKGIGRHKAACLKRHTAAQGNAAFELMNPPILEDEPSTSTQGDYNNIKHWVKLNTCDYTVYEPHFQGGASSEQPDHTNYINLLQSRGSPILDPTDSQLPDPLVLPELPELPELPGPSDPESSDIRAEYHPHSSLPSKIGSFATIAQNDLPPILPDGQPWRPFHSRLDFEIAELILEAALNTSQTNRLLKLIHRATENDEEDSFSLKNANDVSQLWDTASVLRTKFETKTFTVPYQHVDQTFEIRMRDPWDWAMDIVTDSRLAPHLVWDAQIWSHWTGYKWERFVTEPWTAQAFWDTQSLLPDDKNAKVLGFILYADKSKLSSFGTAKAYPIVARLGNLPVSIRNTDGHGGGRVVGWLPIVHEDTAETGKTAFVNFKNAVWHEAFTVFLTTIATYSKLGCWVMCGDGINRWLWPVILILSADYEEMSVMSLIRGLNGTFPCPMCLIPWDQQSDLSQIYPYRTQQQSKDLYQEAMTFRTQKDRYKIMGSQSLRLVKNSMWTVDKTDLHRALSYDTLHFDDNGLWEDHYFKIFKSMITLRQSISKIDDRFNDMPRWRGLNHFPSIMNITFNDGSKNRDISKIFLFAAHDILSKQDNPLGYLLLQCLRLYSNVRMYADFDLHTETSISAGRMELEKFSNLMQEYIAADQLGSLSDIVEFDDTEHEGSDEEETNIPKTKSWNFPKKHLRQHLFKNIEDKGVCRNFGTKPNEKMHRPLRDSYHWRSNFKQYEDQILKADHHLLVSGLIRSNIDALDNYLEGLKPDSEDENQVQISIHPAFDTSEYEKYRKLGSNLKPCTFAKFEEAHQGDKAFYHFRIELGKFMTGFLQQYGIPVPGREGVKFRAIDEITQYQFIKVKYTCTSDWQQKTDYLRCNPSFHGTPRYDCVLVQAEPKPYYARLVCIFTCRFDDWEYPLALIQPYSSDIRGLTRLQKSRDADLELHRVRENLRTDCQFVSIHTFIRGAVLIYADEATHNGFPTRDYFVFDLLDADLFCRERQRLILGTQGLSS